MNVIQTLHKVSSKCSMHLAESQRKNTQHFYWPSHEQLVSLVSIETPSNR